MKIGIDARFLTHPQPGGFKTYTENLITALANIDRDNEYFLYVDRKPGARDLIPSQSNFHTHVVDGSLPAVGFLWREQLQLPKQVAKDKVDLFHSPCLTAPIFLGCPLVVTVHDMIWAFPERFSQQDSWSVKRKLMEWYNYLVPTRAMKQASAIVTVSEAAKNSITKYSNFPSDKIYVVWEAARPSFIQISDENRLDMIQNKYGLHSKFILAIGSADPRKNISTLVQAYSLLECQLQQQYELVIVWTHSHLAERLYRQVNELGLQGKVQFLQNVSNEDLALLYNAASLFAFPSLYEGFGLPLLESMACGTPVVAGNTSSIPEIAGDAALLFDANDPKGIAETIASVLNHDEIRLDLIQKGLQRNTLFSWEECARLTLSVYKEVSEAQRSNH